MPARIKYIYLLLALIVAVSCGDNSGGTIKSFKAGAGKIQAAHAPDLSLNVFAAKLLLEDQKWVLRGESTISEAGEAVAALADSLLGKNHYKNEFINLPDPLLGDSVYAIVQVSVAQLREVPRHSAQLVDQSILGNSLRLLKKNNDWYLVQTQYGYIGWMTPESFHRTDRKGLQNWQTSPKVQVTGLFPLVYSRPSEQSLPVTDAVLNAQLQIEEKGKNWTKVSTPDGRIGFIKNRSVVRSNRGNPSTKNIGRMVIQTAKKMTGIPYLWGGNSSKGNDCSGFTQTVFKTCGIQLLRDARQQALSGVEVFPDENFSNLLPGDLLFFGSGEKITHVGISLGGAEYIHQSGKVHINSLNPADKYFSAYRRKTLKKVKRILEGSSQ